VRKRRCDEARFKLRTRQESMAQMRKACGEALLIAYRNGCW
jgi:hypothetical protein